MAIERTFSIIKPDATRRNLTGKIIAKFEDAGLRVVASKRSGGRLVIRLARKAPRGALLEVPRDALPPPEADAYYVFQLVGRDVVEEGGRALGSVVEVHHGPANDSIELGSGLLLPLVDACVRAVDLDARRILVTPGFADDG